MANKFTNFKFTKEGKSTLTNVLATKGNIAITQVYTFATKLSDSLVFTQLSALNPKQINPVGTVSAQHNTVETRLQIDNSELTTDYNLQGLALVGTYNGDNFVLGYINTNESTNVPAFSGDQVQTIALDVSFAISDTSVITINTQTAGMLTVADYNALVTFIKEQVAPLAVDKKVVHLTNNEIIDGIKTFKKKISGSINGNANTVDYINIHQIAANIDLNTITTNGNYLSVLETKTTSNKPGGTSEQYSLISLGNMQLFSDIKTDKVYIRNQIKTDTFTSWKVVIEDVNQTLKAQFNFSKTPTVNSKPVALQADLATETANRSKADKDINKSLSTETTNRKNGDEVNATAIQSEATARSQADSSASVALNSEKATRSAADVTMSKSLATETTTRSSADSVLTKNINTVSGHLDDEKAARSAADTTLTKAVSDTQKNLKTETTNRSNADSRIDNSAVHKTGNESIAGNKTFSGVTKFNQLMDGAFSNRTAPFKSLSELITKMTTYAGQWRIYTGQIPELPIGDNQWGGMEVIPYNNTEDGGILIVWGLRNKEIFIGYLGNGSVEWHKISNDTELIHKSGNETLNGVKTFSQAIKGSLSGNASTADKLHTARTIGGVKFDGGSNINLPGVNIQGNQNTTGNAASATRLATARKVNGTTFDGTKDISINAANDSNIVHRSGNESVSGEKTFNNKMTVNGVSQANYWYKHVSKGVTASQILEIIDDNFGDGKPHSIGKYYSGYTHGSGIAITANGLTAIGGGESVLGILDLIQKGNNDTTALPMTTMGDEKLILASDQDIYFLMNQQSVPNYGNNWRFSSGGWFDRYDATAKKWINVLPNNSGLVAQNASVVHKSGNETIAGTKSFSSTISGSVNGNAGSADKLKTSRTIGGVNFNGTSNINLPGVNTAGNQSTSGNAGSATKLKTARKINGTAFDGTKDINVNASNDSNLVHRNGNETIGGNKTFNGTVTAGGTKLSDTGWKNLASSSGSVKYRILNGVVYLSVLSAKGAIGSTIATLPAGARPGQDVWQPYYSAKVSGNYKVQPNGKIYRASESSSFNNGESSMWVTFPADN